MTPEAIKQQYAVEADSALITLLTIYGEDDVTPVARLSSDYISRISETANEVIYGVTSRGNDFTFLPLRIVLPSEPDSGVSVASIAINDVTPHVVPLIRTLRKPPKILLELVLNKTPNVVEVVFTDFYISSFTYSADSVSGELSMINFDREPFPQFSFTPQYFPGQF
jgi:hypothetical protein